MPAAARTRRRDDRGAVTAELVMGLPILAAFTLGLVWLLSLAAAQVQVVDAARETARAVARGDDVGAAVDLGRRVAPAGGTVSVEATGAHVVATASAEVDGPGGLFAVLPGVTVTARATALAEEDGGGGAGP